MAVVGGDPITVVMVDDHPIFREGVRRILAQQPDIRLVGEGWVGDHVEKLVREHRPNALLLDLKMRQTDQPQSSRNVFKALPTIFRLHQAFPNLSIIVLSAHLSLPLIEGAFEKGVRGYLLKDDIDPPSLPGAIRSVCGGRLRFSGAVEEFMKQAERRAAQSSPLSRRQKEVILTVATNAALFISGALAPLDSLGWLFNVLKWSLPTTWGIQVTRLVMVQATPLSALTDDIFRGSIHTFALLGIGWLVFGWGLQRARWKGSLSSY